MRFSGTLQTQDDPHGWLKTTLDLASNRLEITAGGESLGSWSLGQVRAERVEGNRFDLTLGEDRAVFLADDALAFSYEALPRLAKNPIAEATQGFRQKLKGGSRKSGKSPSAPLPAQSDEFEPAFATEIDWHEPPQAPPANVTRLRELIEAARANRPEEDEASTESVVGKEKAPEVAVLEIDPPMMLVDPDEEAEPEPLWAGSDLGPRIKSRIEEDSKRFAPKPPPALTAVENTPQHELLHELEQLTKTVSSTAISESQAQAAADLVRGLKALLDP